MTMKHDNPRPMGCSKSSSKKESCLKKQETSQINNLTFTPKAIRERRTKNNPKLAEGNKS